MTPRLALTDDGDLDLSTHLRVETDPVRNVVGKIRKVLLLFQGSWFLDGAKGVPWFQTILAKKNPNFRIVQNLLRAAILTVPEVVSLPKFKLSFNRKDRLLRVDFEAKTTVGLASGSVTVP